AGAIGRWHLAEFSVHRLAADPGREREVGSRPWRGTSATGRGGVLLDHGTHLVYQLLDVAGMPAAVSAWTGRLRHAGYDVEDTAALRFEYPDRFATMFFTWAGRTRENRIRFVGDSGMIEWVDGELRLERDGAVERLDFAAELEKTAYHRWFACLFETFVATLDSGDAGTRFLDDIGRVASVVEHACAIAVARFSLNFMTPLVNVGGEPFKIAAVAPWLGLRRAAGSAVIYQMLHTFGMLLSFLTAVVLGLIFLPHTPLIVVLLATAFVVLAALTLLLLTGHRRGMLAGALDLLHRVPLLDRLARRLEPTRATLASMDEQITQFYHASPRRFLEALALE